VSFQHIGPPVLGGSGADRIDQDNGVPTMMSCGHREGTRPSPTTQIATARRAGPRNDRSIGSCAPKPPAGSGETRGNGGWAWCPNYDCSAISGGDPRQPVSSFFSAMVGNTPDLSLGPVCSMPDASSEGIVLAGMTTIAASGAAPATGAPVDPGPEATPRILPGWSKKLARVRV